MGVAWVDSEKRVPRPFFQNEVGASLEQLRGSFSLFSQPLVHGDGADPVHRFSPLAICAGLGELLPLVRAASGHFSCEAWGEHESLAHAWDSMAWVFGLGGGHW